MSRIQRTRNAKRNIIYGLLLRLYQILVPFLMRTAMIYFMGVQYLGLNSLFTSVLHVLNLAELGVGSAMVYSMYKPIAEDDETTICALMRLYKIYYRVIGLVIACIGCVLTPFIPRLIKGDVPPEINVYILYLLNLGATVISYWLFAYRNSILNAHQRVDIISKVMLATNTLQYIVQLAVLALFKNYYLYVVVLLATQALTNIVTAVISKRTYPQFDARGELPEDKIQGINKRIRDLFTAKVGGVVVNSTDTIVISAFLGLTQLAIYQNYYYILASIISFVTVIFNSCAAGIGNSLIVESKEKNLNDLNMFTFLISWIAGICSCCFLNIFQPFMILWMGKDYLLPYSAVICLVVYYFVYEINQLLNMYKDAGGIWHEDRYRPLVTALSNLGLNLALVKRWGIYGVILSTVISMAVIGMPWIIKNLFSTIFNYEGKKAYIFKLLQYTLAAVVCCTTTAVLCTQIELSMILNIIVRLFISVLVPFICFILLFRHTKEFKDSVVLIDKITNKRFNFQGWFNK